MLFDAVLYINLDRRPDRNDHVKKLLLKHNLYDISTRIDAVDGNKLDLQNISPYLVTKQGIDDAMNGKKLYTMLTKGGIGCALSHRKCYQYIVDNKINRCLVLEDDCYLDDDFNKKLRDLENNIPADFDILFLGHHVAYTDYDYKNVFYFTPNKIYGLFGYIITYKGASKLLEHVFPITKQIDTEIPYHFNKIKTYAITKNNAVVKSDPSAQTYKQEIV